ncbi:MAG: hypothetical protein LBQ00_04010 [Syntrophobacterales bacterium]|jgi:hypothetical protein|nr:hypothetical protein [Syntrophobacterales bacterium]
MDMRLLEDNLPFFSFYIRFPLERFPGIEGFFERTIPFPPNLLKAASLFERYLDEI